MRQKYINNEAVFKHFWLLRFVFLSSVLTGTSGSMADEFEEAQNAIKNENYRVAVVELEKLQLVTKLILLGRILHGKHLMHSCQRGATVMSEASALEPGRGLA